ncbi:unnamed protein product [Clavelina lepadiformis]|uniref:Uncharacterized protein n=1 Tax=Clavelina lepadiformis TaxID=159417 RepID=A0ABP0GH49_CLALP
MYVRILTATSFLIWLSYVRGNFYTSSICWQCDASSHDKCRAQGKLVVCPTYKDICSTVVRRSFHRYQIIKGCKQVESCFNDHRQNWNGENQCKPNSLYSVCRCCCYGDECNTEEMCSSSAVGAEKCESLPTNFQYDKVECTDSNFVDSKCTFSCTQARYELQPSSSEQLTCLSSGIWNKPIPCCALPCPPYIPMDTAFLFHAKHEEDVMKRAIPYIKGRYRNFKAGLPNGFRFTAMFYGETIYEPVLLYEDTENITTAEEFLSKLHIYHNETGTAVNTGAALRYVYNNIFSKNDRPGVPKVLFMHIDENSADDVAAPAKALRDAGVLIFPAFNYVDNNVTINYEQLYEITGVNGHVVVHKQSQEGRIVSSIYETYLHRFCPTVCQRST